MEIYSHPDIPEILSLPGNLNCCDCNAEKPKWSSLNNGIFLCLKCAGIHRSLGVDISTIRSLQIDSWTDKQIFYLSKGGNDKFKQNLLEFNIDPNTQIDLKYKSKAADYYRKILKNAVEKSTNKDYKEIEIIKPSLEEGKELIDIKKGQEEVNNSKVIGQYEQKKEDQGFLNVFGSFLNSVKQTAGDVAGKITKEFNELKIGDKLKDAGDTVAGYAKESGNYIKDKTQQVLNNEYVQGITKTAESGINLVIEKTKNLLNNDNKNQQQNINPNLLNKNDNDENDNIQMSEIINDGNNNDINNDNNINVINNINNDNNIENKKEIKNEEIQKKEEEEKKKDESNSTEDSKNNVNKEENKNESENSDKK